MTSEKKFLWHAFLYGPKNNKSQLPYSSQICCFRRTLVHTLLLQGVLLPPVLLPWGRLHLCPGLAGWWGLGRAPSTPPSPGSSCASQADGCLVQRASSHSDDQVLQPHHLVSSAVAWNISPKFSLKKLFKLCIRKLLEIWRSKWKCYLRAKVVTPVLTWSRSCCGGEDCKEIHQVIKLYKGLNWTVMIWGVPGLHYQRCSCKDRPSIVSIKHLLQLQSSTSTLQG